MTEENKLKFPLKLNLQHFADGEGGDGADQTEDKSGGDDKVQAQGQDDEKQEGRTFTQEDVSNIASKESKSAVEKVLKDLGFDGFDNAKDGVEKFKEYQESQKTEAEKQEGKLKTLSDQLNLSQTENENLKAQMGAYKAGVNPDAVDDVIALAKVQVDDDTDIDTAIAKVVEKYPHFKVEAADERDDTAPKKKTVVGGNPNGGENSKQDAFEALAQKYK